MWTARNKSGNFTRTTSMSPRKQGREKDQEKVINSTDAPSIDHLQEKVADTQS